MRRFVATLGVAVLALPVSLAGTMSSASSATEEITLAGALSDSAGKPLTGHRVSMYVWPAESELAKMSEGDSLAVASVGTATTRSDGSFALVEGAPDPRTKAPGVYDVTVIAHDASGVVSTVETSMERTADRELKAIPGLHGGPAAENATVPRPAATAGPLASVSAPRAETNPAVRLTAAGVPHLQMRTSGHAPSASLRTTDTVSTMTTQQDSGVDTMACSTGITRKLMSKHTNRLTAAGSIHATTNGHRTRFLLSNGSSATLGTAVKYGSSWSASGTVSRELQSETRWGERTGAVHRILQTRYTVGHYKVTVGEYGACSTYYKKTPIVHEGGAESSAGSNPTATYCRNYEKGGGMTLVKNKATNWTNGLSMASIIGFDVSSRSGYSTSEKLDVDITATGRKICGTNAYPADHPSRVVVKNR